MTTMNGKPISMVPDSSDHPGEVPKSFCRLARQRFREYQERKGLAPSKGKLCFSKKVAASQEEGGAA